MSVSVASVSLDRLEDGSARVEWTVEGAPAPVEVAWGASPEPSGHDHPVAVGPHDRAAILDGLPAGPLYVSVRPAGCGPEAAVAAGLRNLALVGPTNFRDLGGYRGTGGATVRWGRIYRADALVIPDEGFDAFRALGVRSIFDLRSTMEVDSTPDRLPPGDYGMVHLPLIGEDAIRPDIDRLQNGEEFLATLYAHILERSAAVFGTVVKAMADESRLPVVFHCAAGKDRTGLVAALVLSVLGVDEQTVLDDYELTSSYRTTEQIANAAERMRTERLVAAEAVAGLLRTPRWTMEKSLSWLEETYGSVEGYLTGPAGVTPAELGRLRTLLLTD